MFFGSRLLWLGLLLRAERLWFSYVPFGSRLPWLLWLPVFPVPSLPLSAYYPPTFSVLEGVWWVWWVVGLVGWGRRGLPPLVAMAQLIVHMKSSSRTVSRFRFCGPGFGAGGSAIVYQAVSRLRKVGVAARWQKMVLSRSRVSLRSRRSPTPRLGRLNQGLLSRHRRGLGGWLLVGLGRCGFGLRFPVVHCSGCGPPRFLLLV